MLAMALGDLVWQQDTLFLGNTVNRLRCAVGCAEYYIDLTIADSALEVDEKRNPLAPRFVEGARHLHVKIDIASAHAIIYTRAKERNPAVGAEVFSSRIDNCGLLLFG